MADELGYFRCQLSSHCPAPVISHAKQHVEPRQDKSKNEHREVERSMDLSNERVVGRVNDGVEVRARQPARVVCWMSRGV